jgi:VWFA-related protein
MSAGTSGPEQARLSLTALTNLACPRQRRARMAAVARHPAALLVWLGLTAGVALAVQAPQLPTFRSGVDIVRLDVSVLDKERRPVRGLTAADFSVTVDGTPQPIVAFNAVAMPPREVPTAPWMRDVAPDVKTNALGEPRLFIILMDDLRTPFDPYMMNTAKAVGRAIVDEMLPSDLASVVFTKDNSHAQELTSDRGLLLAAIESFRGGWIPEERVLSGPMSIAVLRSAVEVLARRPQGRSAIMWISVGGGIADEPDLTARASDRLGRGADEREILRTERDAAIADQMGLTALIEQNRVARIPIYGFGLAGLQAAGTAQINNMAPPELRAPQFTDRSATLGGEGLQALADATGARAIFNDNMPARLVPAVFEENSAYYVVGYKATYPVADGRPRRLQIKVNRPDTIVFPADRVLLSKKPPTGKAAKEAPPPLVRAMSELVPKSDVQLGVTAAPFAFPRGFNLEAPPSGILATLRVTRPAPAEREAEKIELLVKVFTPEGREVGTVRQNAAVALRPSGNDAEFDVLAAIGLKPGRYNVRYSAHSLRLGKTGSVYTDVTVPDFDKEKLSLSGIIISGEPAPLASPRGAFVPIIPVEPTTQREFARTDRMKAFVRIYQGGKRPAAGVGVTARITDANGAERASTASALPATGFGSSRSVDYSYDLQLAALRAGAYLLTIEAKLGSIAARRDVRFSVR